MTDSNNGTKTKGPLGFIILGIIVLALGAGAWFLLKSPSVNPDAVLTEDYLPTDTETLIADENAGESSVADNQAAEPIDIEKAMSIRAVGNPDAPIKVVEYASLTCSHCAHFHNDVFPLLKAKYIDTGKVYFEFREFPLNDPALKGTIAARCLPEEKYADFISVLFKTQAQWAEGIDYMKHLKQNAKLAGLSDAQFEACEANPALKMKIAENMQAAQDKWKVSATPTFIINDGSQTISGAQPLESFDKAFLIEDEKAAGKPKVE